VTSLAQITDLDFLSGYPYCRALRVTCQAVYSGYMPRTTESHRPSDDHHHGMSLDDTSDFMNTLEYESGFLVDHLVTFDDAAHWLTDRGFCPEELAPAALAGYVTHDATPAPGGRGRHVHRAGTRRSRRSGGSGARCAKSPTP